MHKPHSRFEALKRNSSITACYSQPKIAESLPLTPHKKKPASEIIPKDPQSL
jgi:hypothetical protein